MKRSRSLSLEVLEDRTAPATFGNPWPDGAHLTLSFAPDGTAVGTTASQLHESLSSLGAGPAWQREILRAFQTWAVHTNLNLGLITDQGQAFGSAGRPQGDARFGDIRLAGYGMSREVLAIGSPFEATSGTWAGDVKINTNVAFGLSDSSAIDLYSVILHEAGHSLGLEHSDDPTSTMFERYQGQRTGLSAADITAIQALYGVRTPDHFEGSVGNQTIGRATGVSLLKNPDGTLGVGLEADLTSRTDVDVYKFTTPLNPGSLTVRLQTSGLSLLKSRLTVLDSAGSAINSAIATDPANGDLLIKVNNLGILKTYYIKVESGSGDVFGSGAYKLNISLSPLLSSLVSAVTGTVGTVVGLINDDLHTDDTSLVASLLPLSVSQTNSRFDYAYRGSIRDSWDVDFYRIKAPTAAPGTANVMSVMVWGADNGGLLPAITVFNAQNQLVPAEVLVNENGIVTVQIANAVSGATYYVKVAADQPKGAGNVGNYFLGIDFSSKAVELETFVQDTLDAGRPTTSRVLHNNKTQLFHLVLGAQASADVAVRLTVLDRNGAVLATLTAPRGKAVSHTLHLVPGDYLFRFEAVSVNSAAPPPVQFTLRGLVLSDPIGPQYDDSTEDPSGGGSTGYTNPGTSGSGSTSGSETTQPNPTTTSGSGSTSDSGTTQTSYPPSGGGGSSTTPTGDEASSYYYYNYNNYSPPPESQPNPADDPYDSSWYYEDPQSDPYSPM